MLDDAAIRLWRDAGTVVGTLAETYLRSRSINIESPALRFHPRTPFGRKPHTVFTPALIAGVCDDTKLVAVQRLFLQPDGSRSRTIDPPKRGLGVLGNGAVRLAVLCLPVDHLDDHASYIATWLKVVKADPRAILTAAAKAEAATALLLSYRSGEADEYLRAAA